MLLRLFGKIISMTCVFMFALVVGVTRTCIAQSSTNDPLQALSFLEGDWYGEGKSPYGPYEFEAKNERRGRWLLGTSNIYVPGTEQVSFRATGLVGYDEKGLVAYAFENTGVTIFRGVLANDSLYFEWKQGDSYRRRSMRRRQDGTILNREESYLPALSKEPLIFESISKPGKRSSR